MVVLYFGLCSPVGSVLVKGNGYFLPHQKVPRSKCFLLSLLPAPFTFTGAKIISISPFHATCELVNYSAKAFPPVQSDRVHWYFHISCTDFCPNALGEIENDWMTSVSQSLTQQGRMTTPAKVSFSSQQCLTLPLGLKCFCPSVNSSSISFLGFATILLFSGLLFLVLFKWRKRCSL